MESKRFISRMQDGIRLCHSQIRHLSAPPGPVDEIQDGGDREDDGERYRHGAVIRPLELDAPGETLISVSHAEHESTLEIPSGYRVDGSRDEDAGAVSRGGVGGRPPLSPAIQRDVVHLFGDRRDRDVPVLGVCGLRHLHIDVRVDEQRPRRLHRSIGGDETAPIVVYSGIRVLDRDVQSVRVAVVKGPKSICGYIKFRESRQGSGAEIAST